MAQRTFHAFVDESGQKEYGTKTSRYFVYAGVFVDQAQIVEIEADIRNLKRRTFGSEDVEIKSNWLRQPKERQARYLRPFGIDDQILTAFVDEVSDLMRSQRMSYVACAVDKLQMKKKYGDRAHNPSATAYLFLAQRYEIYCERYSAKGNITVDDMTGSSAAKNQWRELLRRQHERLKSKGCPLTGVRFPQLANGIRFADSRRYGLLQLADLMAYNVFRQFKDFGEDWDRGGDESLPVYPALRPFLRRFQNSPEGRLEGWGIVKYPQRASASGKWGFKQHRK